MKFSRRRPWFFVLAVLAAVATLGFFFRAQIQDVWLAWQQPVLPPTVTWTQVQEPAETAFSPNPPSLPAASDIPVASVDPPSRFRLAVPFTPQAPTGNWELPYQEFCEEASVLMALRYFEGTPDGLVDPSEADAALLALKTQEEKLFGFYEDTTAAETKRLLEAVSAVTVEEKENPTVRDIQEAVASGFPVIVPAAGRRLGNPFYTSPGPLYHMLVVTGYTEDGFITNDPGTRRGMNYVYPFDVFMEAIHDWNGGDVEHGRKVVLIVEGFQR